MFEIPKDADIQERENMRIFVGTNILETFQRIISEKSLDTPDLQKPFIRYGVNSISLLFNPQPQICDPNTGCDFPSDKYFITYDSLTVQKTGKGENRFSLTINQSNPTDILRRKNKSKTGNSSKIIRNIIKFTTRETGHKLNP